MRTMLVALWWGSAASAGVPEVVHYSGRLLGSDGVPMSGLHHLDVTVYAGELSSTVEWDGAFDEVLQDGYFSIELGAPGDPFDLTAVDSGDAWVEVVVDSTTTLPRQRLASVPYAIQAEPVVESGSFTPVVEMMSGDCITARNTFQNATGTYRKIGPLVFVTITDLPTGASHAQHCIARISGLPYTAAANAAFSIGHARGIQFKYNQTIHTDFTMSAQVTAGESHILTSTSYAHSPFSGYWYLYGSDSGTYVHSVSGTYLAAE